MKRISWSSYFFAFTVLSFAFANTAEAQRGRSSRGGGPGLFSAGVMVSMGQGKMGNGADVQDRTMLYTPVAAFLGLNFRKFRLGGQFEYSIVGQSDDPAGLNNQNLSGKGSATGVRLDYWDGKQSFGVIYRISDTYKLDQQSVSGTDVEYKAKSGFQVQYYRQIKKRFGFVIDYTTQTFDESLTEKVKMDRISLGLVLTNFSVTGGGRR